MTRGFNKLRKTDVICRRGADPIKMLTFVQLNRDIFKKHYKVDILHIGTNFFSDKHEWGKYLEMVNDQCTFAEYKEYLDISNLTPSKGSVYTFHDILSKIVKTIQRSCKASVLVSGIIPRPWDHDRRGNIIPVYNKWCRAWVDPP